MRGITAVIAVALEAAEDHRLDLPLLPRRYQDRSGIHRGFDLNRRRDWRSAPSDRDRDRTTGTRDYAFAAPGRP